MRTKKTEEKWWNSERLRFLIDDSGMTHEHIADAAGIPRASFNLYLKEEASPPTDRLIKLADLFGVPLDYICGRCTREECDAIEESFADNFRLLRRKDYETCILKRVDHWKRPNDYEAPYPYNLLDDIFGETFDHMLTEDEEKGLNVCLSMLSDREQEIIKLRYGKEMTLVEAGRKIGVTQERIRQIQAKALRKLRHPVRSNYILYGEQGNKKKMELDIRERDLNLLAERLNAMQKQIELKESVQSIENVKPYNYDEPKPCKYGRNGLTYSDAFMDLELSIRAFNCLARAGCLSVSDVVEKIRDGSIIKVRNLGRKTLEEVIERIKKQTGMTFEELVGNQEYAS